MPADWYDRIFLCLRDTKTDKLECVKFSSDTIDQLLITAITVGNDPKHVKTVPICKYTPHVLEQYSVKRALKNEGWSDSPTFFDRRDASNILTEQLRTMLEEEKQRRLSVASAASKSWWG